MKVDIVRKYKWYIMGIIAAILITSIGLSFCVWDTTSIDKIGDMKASTADYNKHMYKLAAVDDKNNNSIADVGEVVTFGNYWQDANATAASTKAPIRWIVVHKAPNIVTGVPELTLLAESIMAFGTFWGRYYYTQPNGDPLWENNYIRADQNYSSSTLEKWLNADTMNDDSTSNGRTVVRTDGGTGFSANAPKLGMRGFLDEAFTAEEQAYINNRKISGVKGYPQQVNTSIVDYATITPKVWVPSWSEIYGGTSRAWGQHSDGSPNAQFSYFSGVGTGATPKLVARTTAFASTPGKSNYIVAVDTTHINNAAGVTAGGAATWYLRSPDPSNSTAVLVVKYDGQGINFGTMGAGGGVRPAIAVPA